VSLALIVAAALAGPAGPPVPGDRSPAEARAARRTRFVDAAFSLELTTPCAGPEALYP
jgi:hypothetical protein